MHCDTSTRPIFDLTKAPHPRAVHAEVLRYIRGIRGPRATLATRRLIGKWLSRTPAAAIDAALVDLISEGAVMAVMLSPRQPQNAARRAVGYEGVR